MFRIVWAVGAILAASSGSVAAQGVTLAQSGGHAHASVGMAPEAPDLAGGILQRAGLTRGVCLLVDPAPGGLAVELARRSELIVYAQLPDEAAVAAARSEADAAGLLGTRVYVEKGPWSRLHLADNLADLVVVTPAAAENLGGARDELLRVVNPLGAVLLGDDVLRKPFPEEAADWSHHYYGPDNNCQSADRLARAPYLTQFLSEPWYVPFPEVTVTAAGRVFKAFGHVGYKERDWPWLNRLVALSGYNGTILWQRDLEDGFNIHRSTMVATREALYVADSRSCKRLDAATGEPRGEIVAPEGASGKVWKWMAIEDGILYALVGEEEPRDETLRDKRTGPGWPWTPMTRGYDDPSYRWGFGRTFFAYDLGAQSVLWMHHEEEPIDGRAVGMRDGRIYAYSEQKYVVCLDAREGKPLWRQTGEEVLAAIGPTGRAQSWQSGFSTTAYLTVGDEALYFAGPQRPRSVALSTDGGRLLWHYPDGNLRVLLRAEGLYGMGKTGPSKLFDPLTGEIRADLPALRGNCTRVTGSLDSVFARGDNHGGTLRLIAASNTPLRIAAMRPDCHGGVIVANGLLYWGPWMCDCNLSLVGVICLAPAGDFDFSAEATEAERLEPGPPTVKPSSEPPVEASPADWPAYRADNRRSAALDVELPTAVERAWRYRFPEGVEPAAPIIAAGTVYLSGSDGAIRAVDAATGELRWTAHTGGAILFPPAWEAGRLFAGSADGWVYAFDAASGARLWRFRAAPTERRIMVYGRLGSTWPVAGGVLVENGVVYAAAGIASYDGTHVYALDAASGRILWQNNTSGRLAGEDRVTGVSVQGHLLMHDGKLYLAGGNVVSPAVFDPKDGRCLSRLDDEWVKAPRGRDLYVLDGKVTAFDRLLYAPPRYWPGRYFARHLFQADAGDVVIRATDGRVVRIASPEGEPADRSQPDRKEPRGLWEWNRFGEVAALGLGANAVVVAGRGRQAGEDGLPLYSVDAQGLANGEELWTSPLPDMPVLWGVALERAGRVVVATRNGEALCLVGTSLLPGRASRLENPPAAPGGR